MGHWTSTIYIKNQKIKVDRKIANLILILNSNNLYTKYCCQGDKYNSGYIYFENNIDIDKALYCIRSYYPKSISLVESIDPCVVRIFHTKTALENTWKSHQYLLRMIKKSRMRKN